MVIMGDFSNDLLKYIIRQEVERTISETENNAADKVESLSIKILEEIVEILKNHELSDFDIVENIVCIMEKYEIDCGTCHDFG